MEETGAIDDNDANGRQGMSTGAAYKVRREALAPDALMAEAAAATGLSDFGGTAFVAPLSRFMERAAREIEFRPGRINAFRAEILRHLINRLRFADDLRRHPEILDEDVTDPIVITGLPRTGTTKLQRMLSAAPNVQKLYLWRMLNPAPFPGAAKGRRDPRMTSALGGEGVGSETTQEHRQLRAAHELALTQVDEEVFLFDFTLDQSICGASAAYLPLFFHLDWLDGARERQADREGYLYLRTLLQYLQWQDGGKRNRPWIMKLVSHMAHFDALLEYFPKATIAQTHRDPCLTVPSISKLMFELWSINAVVNKEPVGNGFLQWSAAAMNRCIEARDRMQLDARILDIPYATIRDDIMPSIREIYRRNGRELTVEAEQAMREWERDNEQGKHGQHSYSLAEFGLDETQVAKAFAEYTRRFSSLFQPQPSLSATTESKKSNIQTVRE